MERTLILDSSNWIYNKNGFEDIFKPLSDTCLEASEDQSVPWPGTQAAKVVKLPIVDVVDPRPKFLPPGLPVSPGVSTCGR